MDWFFYFVCVFFCSVDFYGFTKGFLFCFFQNTVEHQFHFKNAIDLYYYLKLLNTCLSIIDLLLCVGLLLGCEKKLLAKKRQNLQHIAHEIVDAKQKSL
jgi:membrane protein insertase Oxa1/YidC/SpoIIIJ